MAAASRRSGSTSTYVGSIDQGTTSTRFILFDKKGSIVASAHEEHTQHTTAEGHVEHDALEILARTLQVVVACMQKANAVAADLAAIGITNQRETTLVWNPDTGEPLTRAVVWMDTRAAKICQTVSKELGGRDSLAARTGLPIVPYFSGPKLKWLLDHTDGLREKAEGGKAVFGTIDSWLAWCLTGGPGKGRHITDVTNASRTLLMDLDTLDWAKDLCGHFDVPMRMLPQIVSSSETYADCDVWTGPDEAGLSRQERQNGTKASKFLEGVPLAGILGDQQAALFGQACFEPGQTKNTYGTGCFMLRNTGQRRVKSSHGLLTTVAYKIGDEPAVFGLEGSVSQAGSVVQWMRDNLKLFSSSSDVQKLAEEVEDSGGLVFVPAFSGLFAPRWRDDARGIIVGLTKGSCRGHICRAALEATCFQSRELAVAMAQDVADDAQAKGGAASTGNGEKADSAPDLTMRVDGGMTVNGAMLQMQADVLGSSVQRPAVIETTALGAAYAAGLAVGFWSSLDDLRDQWELDAEFKPAMEEEERQARVTTWERAVERSLGWATDGQENDVPESAVEAAGSQKEKGDRGKTPAPAFSVLAAVACVAAGAVLGAAAVSLLGGVRSPRSSSKS